MGVKVTGGGGIINRLRGMANHANKMPDFVGAYVVQEIVDRTQKGMDMNRHGFTPYIHPEVRTKGGRQSNHVDLNWSGQMLASMMHKVNGNQTLVFFRAEKENAKAHGHHHGSKWLPQRKFFGLDPKIKQGIIDRIQRWIAS